jgi:hypothetical protein
VTSLSSSTAITISTIFESFQSVDSEQTAWARRLLKAPHPSDDEIAMEVQAAVVLYCPNIPDEHIPFITDLLGAAIRFARREECLRPVPPAQQASDDAPADIMRPRLASGGG